jgi:hypothetical protein
MVMSYPMFAPARAADHGPRRLSWNRHAKIFFAMAPADRARSAAFRIVPHDFLRR